MLHCWPRGVWIRMRRLAMRRLKKTNLQRLKQEQAEEALLSHKRCFGFGTCHLAPKDGGGFRQILNLSKLPATKRAAGHEASVNFSLKPVFQFLTAICHRLPALHGTSVCGLSQAHERWRSFVAELRLGARRGHPGSDELHFSSTDISNCYDTIDKVRRRRATTKVSSGIAP